MTYFLLGIYNFYIFYSQILSKTNGVLKSHKPLVDADEALINALKPLKWFKETILAVKLISLHPQIWPLNPFVHAYTMKKNAENAINLTTITCGWKNSNTKGNPMEPTLGC